MVPISCFLQVSIMYFTVWFRKLFCIPLNLLFIFSILMDFLTKNVDKSITLEVKEDNIPAIKLYKKYNFEKKAIRAGYYNGVDGLLMERKKDSH